MLTALLARARRLRDIVAAYAPPEQEQTLRDELAPVLSAATRTHSVGSAGVFTYRKRTRRAP